MQTSFFLAKLLGPPFVLLGLAVLTKAQSFRVMLSEFVKSRVLTYVAGVLGLFAGLAMVLAHNIWSSDWRVLITLVGWTTILRAMLAILAPQWAASVATWFLRHRGGFAATAVIAIAIGATLSYFGYSA